MMDMLVTSAALWAATLAPVVLLAAARVVRLNLAWLAAAIVFFLAYSTALTFIGRLIPIEAWFGELTFNWGGKVAAITTSLAILAGLWVIARKAPRESGVTLVQAPGSLLPAIVAAALLIAIAVGSQVALGDGPDVTAERLWFQGTMPGLDEELLWRGVFLLALNEGVRGGRLNLLGAPISWGGAAAVLMFGTAHGLAVQDGQVMFSAIAVAVTGLLGFGLLWIRERTGSILVPIIAHNLINFTGSFF